MTGPAEPPPGTYMPHPLPDCYRCGRPAAEHRDGLCPADPLPDCNWCGRRAAEHRDGKCPVGPGSLRSDVVWAAKKGFGTAALLAAVGSGLAWFWTTASSPACTFTGQVVGGSCLPVLSDIHNAAGPLALVLLAAAALLFFVPTRR